MKRTSALLVAYSSSDDDESTNTPAPEVPPSKKRKLPQLSETIATPLPQDNPALHQGRLRTTPHVEGQFAAHVYVSLPLEKNSSLYKLVKEVIRDARGMVPTLHETAETNSELHVSLSRPIFLRAHQREDLKREIRNTARGSIPFTVSFAAFSELINDEKTRTFLAMEIGAGHHELRALSDALTPILQSLRQKEYYAHPRFHASIAWALVDRPALKKDQKCADHDDVQCNNASNFPTIPHLPKELIPTLDEKHGAALSSSRIGSFHVEDIYVKIGKEVSSWHLKGH